MLLLEVMDKMPSAARLLAVGVAVGMVGFALVHRWRWATLPALALGAVIAWTRVQIYSDPHVGPVVWLESGWPYAVAVALSALLALGLPLLGLMTRQAAGGRSEGTG